MLKRIIDFFLGNRLVTWLLLILLLIWGVVSSPFGSVLGFLPSDPVPVDAIPDIGENQQIVTLQWPGRSPRDMDDQVAYPLTTALLGMPGVKTIRSQSIFGLASIYIIFEEDMDFYWSRTRILEKLNSLPAGTLPGGVTPSLGPDATALGQIFWYTLEGRDPRGRPSGGWDPHELRSIQDYYVRPALTSAAGVAEVASVGGFVKEYQVDIDPHAMKARRVTVPQIVKAVRRSNLDAGARTLELNRAEYLVRALGYVKSVSDLEESVVAVRDHVPVRIGDVARVSLGPATRRGGLDKDGAEATGGVVVARYGDNPMEVIENVKAKIAEISPGLPSRTLDNGTESKITLVPFYDRTGLIRETLGTLEEALTLEILISLLVVVVLVANIRASLLISGLLPLGVLMTFIVMRRAGVDANIVALSGIAIAIGVMVDVGVVFTENILRRREEDRDGDLTRTISRAASEVGPAVLTAMATTIVSFLPVFALQAAEGKLFRPLAFTKSFAMLSALVIGLVFIPAGAHLLLSLRVKSVRFRGYLNLLLLPAGVVLALLGPWAVGLTAVAAGFNHLLPRYWKAHSPDRIRKTDIVLLLLLVTGLLTTQWMPLGVSRPFLVNLLFVWVTVGAVLGGMHGLIRVYPRILTWALAHKGRFLAMPAAAMLLAFIIWQGFDGLFGFMPRFVRESGAWQAVSRTFPGLGSEFMPALDEGSFLLMPSTMPHSGVEENLEVIRLLDRRISAIPEVASTVGKWGRVNSALDPAPVSMFENVINYKTEYIQDEKGHRLRFKVDRDGAFVLRGGGTYRPGADEYRNIDPSDLIRHKRGRYFRQWRDNIRSPDDIWNEIAARTSIPGLTSAPRLQPIQTRLVMLQTGMRAPMGVKVSGPDLESIESFGLQLETILKGAEGVKTSSVFADRVVGKPYLMIRIDRKAIARHGLTVEDVQSVITTAVGGTPQTWTVEGRERYAVRVRYAREFRDSPEALKHILLPSPGGFVPLGEVASIEYERGAQMIKTENTFLVSYVIFDRLEGFAETDVVENARSRVRHFIESGELTVPPGVSFQFTGNYENQVRANRRLALVIPVSLFVIFLILYFQFRSVTGAALIFTGVLVAFSGAFIMLWLYSLPGFMTLSLSGVSLREVFQIHPVNLSVAVWVGFIALFGVATDDGVLISTYLMQVFRRRPPDSVEEVRANVLQAGSRRIRPAVMTTATTIIALMPVISSTGKGSDIMAPMAIPTVGGMLMAVLTWFTVPVLYSLWQERRLGKEENDAS